MRDRREGRRGREVEGKRRKVGDRVKGRGGGEIGGEQGRRGGGGGLGGVTKKRPSE